MPELPEVETTRRAIERFCLGRAVAGVRASGARMRVGSRRTSAAPLTGAALAAVRRRAKFLLLDFTGGSTLLVHLGMTGTLRCAAPGDAPRTHDHLTLRFEDGGALVFNDPRRFGLYELWPTPRVEASPHLGGLGPEPLSAAFTGAALHAASRGRRIALKPLLMDPSVVVGVGNIYASEACHRARLDPRLAAARLSRDGADRLARETRAVLRAAIRAGGTTLRDFTAPDGARGYFRIKLSVYDRAGLACGRCGGTIRRIVQAQRASFYCPGCQRR